MMFAGKGGHTRSLSVGHCTCKRAALERVRDSHRGDRIAPEVARGDVGGRGAAR